MREMGQSEIDGKKYQVGHWPVDKATGMLTRLVKLLGEPLAMVLLGAINEKKDGSSVLDVDVKNLKGDAIAAAFKGLATRLDETEVKKMFREFTVDILCDGKKVDYDAHFMGQIGHLFRVSVFVLRHQYQDFLAASPALDG